MAHCRRGRVVHARKENRFTNVARNINPVMRTIDPRSRQMSLELSSIRHYVFLLALK